MLCHNRFCCSLDLISSCKCNPCIVHGGDMFAFNDIVVYCCSIGIWVLCNCAPCDVRSCC